MAALGAIVGATHSLEADHLAAVATLVEDEEGRRAGVIGTSWGIGHAVPIALVGVAFLLAGRGLPEAVSWVAELVAGAVLVLLGLRTVYGAVETTTHSHGGSEHVHLSLGPVDLGATHSHREGESLFVGVLHGLAGSGVAIAALATGATLPEGVSLLGGFAVASILTMGALALLWGTVLSTAASRVLRAVAGAAAVGIGLLLLAGEGLGMELAVLAV